MRKGEEKKIYELTCDYCRDKFNSSKPYARFDSVKHRIYFFAKKKVLVDYIQTLERMEIHRFKGFIGDLIEKGTISENEWLRHLREHNEEMWRLEVRRKDAEQILIAMQPSPSKIKLTQKMLALAMNIILPSWLS